MALTRAEFDHIGIVTSEQQDGERWVEATRVWVTSPREHAYNVEWLRYEDDSPVTGPVRTQPHVAFRVESIEKSSQGMKVLLEPFRPMEGLLVGFYQSGDGAVIELMEYSGSLFANA